MAVVQKSAVINAPAEQVFAIVEDPRRAPELSPGVTRVDDIRQSPGRIGDSYRTIYSVVGREMPMTFTVLEYDRPRKIVTKMDGQMTGTFTMLLTPRGDATEVNARIDYEMKGGLFGKALNALGVERMNEKNTEQLLENLKAMCEAGRPAQAVG